MRGVRILVPEGDAQLAEAVTSQPQHQRVPGDDGWIWLLDGSALPAPDCLPRLLDAADRLAGIGIPPALLASRVVHDRGELASDQHPLAAQDRTALAIHGVGQRVFPVRAVTSASVLLSERFADAIPERPVRGQLDWTARALETGTGFIVPASIAVARGRVARTRADVGLLLGDSLTARERLRLAGSLVERLGPGG